MGQEVYRQLLEVMEKRGGAYAGMDIPEFFNFVEWEKDTFLLIPMEIFILVIGLEFRNISLEIYLKTIF